MTITDMIFLRKSLSGRGGRRVAVKFSLQGFDVVDRLEDDLQLGEVLLVPPLVGLVGEQEPQPLNLPGAQSLP